MLEKDPAQRITAEKAMEHPWFGRIEEESTDDEVYEKVLKRLQSFSGRSKLRRAAINIIIK